ncbi:cobyrinic acid a,c-diamide synthase [Candidatus Bathyarchaeota archaeon]|nr:MAG: cobyrinic acid a,c-diamide synthase [Candidatus Bathyarchaeota archaeon]
MRDGKALKIAVTGKGGVGKTFVAAGLAYFLANRNFRVIAIDADPTPNLALTLGIPREKAAEIVPVSENKKLIEEKTGTGFSGVYRLSFTVDDVVRDFSYPSPLGVNLLVMGTVRSAGSGCMCPANAVIRALLRHLIVERDEAVILDMEAGIEHLGRGTARHVDLMLAVADSNLKALETAGKIAKLASDMQIEKVFLVGNKVSNRLEEEAIVKFASEARIKLLGFIPYDEKILEADRLGKSPFLCAADASAVRALMKLGEKLLSYQCM